MHVHNYTQTHTRYTIRTSNLGSSVHTRVRTKGVRVIGLYTCIIVPLLIHTYVYMLLNSSELYKHGYVLPMEVLKHGQSWISRTVKQGL